MVHHYDDRQYLEEDGIQATRVILVGTDGEATNPSSPPAGSGEIEGTVAHDTADAGNPVKIGGKASAAAPANVTEGDRVNASFDLAGQLRVVGASAGAAAGDVAHDAADSGNPIKIGGKASAAAPANVTEGDRVNASFDLAGQLRVVASVTAGATAGDSAHDAADTGNPVKIGGKGTDDVAAAVTEGDRVNASFDRYGQLRIVSRDGIDAYASAVVLTAPAALNDTDVGRLRMTPYRAEHVSPRDEAGASLDLGTLGQPVAVTVPATAGGISMLAAAATRRSAIIYNNGAQAVYYGPTSAVTAAIGMVIPVGGAASFSSWKGAVFGIVAATTAEVRVIQELAV